MSKFVQLTMNGIASKKVPEQLRALEDYGLDGAGLADISKAVAKVDNAGVQDGYQLYQHLFFVDAEENWTVVQQGMDFKSNDARRYHWTAEETRSFIDEPHTGLISGEVRNTTLDMTSKLSHECRKVSMDIIKEDPARIRRYFEDIKTYGETTLIPWMEDEQDAVMPSYKVVPTRMNWNAVRRAYETSPDNYEKMILTDGFGPATIRGLSLISEMIFGTAPSWSDPVRMTFAFGGKDGVPFPVPRKDYDKAIEFMEQVVNDAKMDRREKVLGLKRLRKFAPPVLREDIVAA
ncbi:MAG: DUF763 domain-containing protein [Candidatus Thorarchaeota archaeon]